MSDSVSPGVIEFERRMASKAAFDLAVLSYDGLAKMYRDMGDKENEQKYRAYIDELLELGRKRMSHKAQELTVPIALVPR